MVVAPAVERAVGGERARERPARGDLFGVANGRAVAELAARVRAPAADGIVVPAFVHDAGVLRAGRDVDRIGAVRAGDPGGLSTRSPGLGGSAWPCPLPPQQRRPSARERAGVIVPVTTLVTRGRRQRQRVRRRRRRACSTAFRRRSARGVGAPAEHLPARRDRAGVLPERGDRLDVGDAGDDRGHARRPRPRRRRRAGRRCRRPSSARPGRRRPRRRSSFPRETSDRREVRPARCW